MDAKTLIDRTYHFLDQELDSEVEDLTLSQQNAYLRWSREEILSYLNESIHQLQQYVKDSFYSIQNYTYDDLDSNNSIALPENNLGLLKIIIGEQNIPIRQYSSFDYYSLDSQCTMFEGSRLRFNENTVASSDTITIEYCKRLPYMMIESDYFPMESTFALQVCLMAASLALIKDDNLSKALEFKIEQGIQRFISFYNENGETGELKSYQETKGADVWDGIE